MDAFSIYRCRKGMN